MGNIFNQETYVTVSTTFVQKQQFTLLDDSYTCMGKDYKCMGKDWHNIPCVIVCYNGFFKPYDRTLPALWRYDIV